MLYNKQEGMNTRLLAVQLVFLLLSVSLLNCDLGGGGVGARLPTSEPRHAHVLWGPPSAALTSHDTV